MIRLALRVRREDAELALAELLELAPAGVEETELPGDVVEYAVYGAPGELPELPALRAAAGDALVEIETFEVADDWGERWRAFHRAVVVRGDRGAVEIRPPWDQSPGAADAQRVTIDPGQAFGTGAHDTTRLCLELLLGIEPAGSLADLGCGSGVLAIAAARLGWRPVRAVDHDPASVEATRANAAVNGVELEVARLDLRRERPPGGRVVVANLVAPLLHEAAGSICATAAGVLVLGGMLRAEADGVAAAYTSHRYSERRRLSAGDWTALELAAV
jgi:ribosomal protein L11 methyltransferase